MICRMWHGRTPRSKADAYALFLEERAIPDSPDRFCCNLSVEVMRRDEDAVTHFLTVTHWDSATSIRAFAGDDLLKAKYYPEDKDYLVGVRTASPALQRYCRRECRLTDRRAHALFAFLRVRPGLPDSARCVSDCSLVGGLEISRAGGIDSCGRVCRSGGRRGVIVPLRFQGGSGAFRRVGSLRHRRSRHSMVYPRMDHGGRRGCNDSREVSARRGMS